MSTLEPISKNGDNEEEEESGDEDDMGKYMIESDDDEQEKAVETPTPPPQAPAAPLTPTEEDEEPKKNEVQEQTSIRDFMDDSMHTKSSKFRGNKLPVHGNERTMNLNHLILANITESAYFRTDLVQHRGWEDMVDEIYYRVQHLEAWEKGSRKAFTGSSSGGERGLAYSSIPGVSNYVGVRGVGQGGIVSTPFCCLYKLWTMKMSRHQVMKMLNHTDSPYIRGVGFLYLRFSLPPEYLLQFFEDYLEDDEEVDPKAGGGDPMTVGVMCQRMLEDTNWYGVMFPRIPAKHLKEIRDKCRSIRGEVNTQQSRARAQQQARNRRDRSRSPGSKRKRRDPRDLGDEPTNSGANRGHHQQETGQNNRRNNQQQQQRPPTSFRSTRY